MIPENRLYKPVFLVGTTRSGTTLLSLILDHHPKINFVGEFEWVFDYPGDLSDDISLDSYYCWLQTNRFFHSHKIQLTENMVFSDLARDFFSQMNDVKQNDNEIVGVQLHRHYHRVLELWPNAKFIHIVRDGRDVCASWMKFGWQGNSWKSGQEWKSLIQQWFDLKHQLSPENYIELRFEDLVSDTKGELSRITDFLELKYDPQMLSYPEDTTYDAVNSKHIGKWKKLLSKQDVRLFEFQARRELEHFGYNLFFDAQTNTAPKFMWWVNLDDKIKKNIRRARHLGLGLWVGDHVSRRLKIKSWRDKIQLAINEKTNASLQ